MLPQARISTKNRPDQVRVWMRLARKYDDTYHHMSGSELVAFANEFKQWWMLIQPEWRIEGRPRGLVIGE